MVDREISEEMMGTMKDTSEISKLRQQAEKDLGIEPGDTELSSEMSPEKMKGLIHELQVHQIELKMQNEELRRIQRELEETRDRYSHLYNFAPIGYFALNQKGLIDEANLTIASMLGLDRSALIGQPFTRFILKDDQDTFYKHRQGLLETETFQSCELRLVKEDGHVFHARLECVLLRNKGDLKQIRITASDVTDRKQAEEALLKAHYELERRVEERTAELAEANHELTAEINNGKRAQETLRESEQRYRRLAENSPDMIYRMSLPNGMYEYVSPAATSIFGHTPEAWYENPCFIREIIHPDWHSYFETEWENLLNGHVPPTYEYKIIHKDKSVRWINQRNILVKGDNGSPVAVEGIISDITDRKLAEEALRESEEKLRVIFDTVYSGMILVDATGTITFANRRMAEMFGHDMEEFIGSSYPEYVHETQSDEGKQKMLQLIRGDIDHVFVERLYRRKDGTVFWGQISGSRLCHPDGSFSSLVYIITDISEKKKLEAQLQQAHKIEAISTLTSGIAHDYNNLLAIIIGNLSMAQDETDPRSVMAGLLREIGQASSKASNLTHQLMTLSHGGYPMKKMGSIGSLVKEIPIQVQAHDGIEYIFSIQDDLWPVEFDSRQMHYAISNVLTNAVEAMPQGGTITIQAESQVIEDRDKDSPVPLKEGKYVRISIKDEGRGIPKEHLNQIFVPYFSTKERGVQKGMGLGLNIAYAVVQKHGGYIMVNSTTGAGTTVTIYLPAAEERRKRQRAKHKSVDIAYSISSGDRAIKRILVMDDEESLRILAQKMLERLGHEVETVKDGVEAIETYKKHMDSGEPFDGVILDLTIKGGMGGEQTIRELMKIDPNVKAIVCSGYFNDPVMANYEEHGFRGAMDKPYKKSDLESVLKKVLR